MTSRYLRAQFFEKRFEILKRTNPFLDGTRKTGVHQGPVDVSLV